MGIKLGVGVSPCIYLSQLSGIYSAVTGTAAVSADLTIVKLLESILDGDATVDIEVCAVGCIHTDVTTDGTVTAELDTGSVEIADSIMLDSSASQYLSRTPSVEGNRKTWTFSDWVKRGELGSSQWVFTSGASGNDEFAVRFASDDTLIVESTISASYAFRRITNAVYRDPSAWYHIVVTIDTTEAVAADRVTLAVNGVVITSFSTSTDPALNEDTYINSTVLHALGIRSSTTAEPLDGYLSDTYLIDGLALDATSFGEFGSAGNWIPIEYTGNYGTNGFHLNYADGIALGADVHSDTDPATDYTSRWTMDDTTGDDEGGGLDGTWSSTPDVTAGVIGNACGAASASLDLSSHAALIPDGATKWTVSWWMKKTTNAQQTCLMFEQSSGTGSTYTKFGIFLETSGKINVYYRTTPTGGSTVMYSTATSHYTLGEWTHYTLVVDLGGSGVNLYKDGVAGAWDTTATEAITTGAATKGKYIASSYLGVDSFSGYVDDVRLYDRTLTATEIADLYAYKFNNYTTNGGIDATNQVQDTPTDNFCVLNAIHENASTCTFSRGNKSYTNSTAWSNVPASIAPVSGKWYVEFDVTQEGTNHALVTGISTLESLVNTTNVGDWTGSIGVGKGTAGPLLGIEGSYPSAGYTIGANDRTLLALDCDNGKAWVGYYDDSASSTTWYNSSGGTTGNPSTGANPTMTFTAEMAIVYASYDTNTSGYEMRIGSGDWSLTPPTDFLALSTVNLPDSTVPDGSAGFDVVLTDGASIKGDTEAVFANSLRWMKDRVNANNHQLMDSVGGTAAVIQSNTTAAETAYSAPAGNSVGWVWNKDPAYGMDIVPFVGTSSAHTENHSLGVPLEMIICKNRDMVQGWTMWHKDLTSAGYYIQLNRTNAEDGPYATLWNNTAPTSSVFSVGTDNSVNANGDDIIAYLFASVEGFSKFGSYVGNGSTTDAPFINTGFSTRFILIKNITSISEWVILDAERNPYNVANLVLSPNGSTWELGFGTTNRTLDFLSNGVKIRYTTAGGMTDLNASGNTYIYAAFASNPFKLSTAR